MNPNTPAPAPSRSRLPAGGNPALMFVAKAAIWVLLLFAFVRIPWVQQHLLLPFAGFQGRVACALAGTSPNSVVVGLSCTGADPMALVLGAILAFPVAWSRRLAGAALGLGMVLVLNTARIGTLSLVVDRTELFRTLHIYVWPAVLIVAAASYVFLWMAHSLRGRAPRRNPAADLPFSRSQTVKFLGLTVVFVTAFFLLSPWLMSSPAVLGVARWATVAAAAVMTVLGISVEVSGNTLRTSSGAWVVTQACVATPLLPVYLAAVLLMPGSAFRRVIAALAALPIFLFLGSARLLVLALPAALVGSHSTAIHAFYQVITAVLLVVWVARRSKRPTPSAFRALAAGVACAYLAAWIGNAWLWPVASASSSSLHFGHGWIDGQGALALMPPFQIALLIALWLALDRSLRERRFVAAIAGLAAVQLVIIVLAGELAVHAGFLLPVAGLRAASLALPLAATWWASRIDAPASSGQALSHEAPTAPPLPRTAQ